MKTRFYILLAAVLCLAACEKNNGSNDKQRDITYTVGTPSPNWHMPDGNRRPMETVTVHLETEAEWQALLDRFCDYAEDGSEVTFYNGTQAASLRSIADKLSASQKSQAASPRTNTKDATTFSTTDREAMKRWMAQMEDEGMTVTVTFDSNTGTWNGTAYATAPQPRPGSRQGCHTGVLTQAPMRAMSAGEVPPGLDWALQVGDTLFYLVTDGHFITANGETLTLDSDTYHLGDSITLCGIVLTMQDYYGNEFFVLELGEAPGHAHVPFCTTYVCDRWPDYIAIMTVSPASRVYGTWATNNGWSLYGLPWGICGYMFSGFTCLECPQEYHFTNIYWSGIDVSGTSQLHGDTLHMEYGGTAPQCNTCISVFDMVRSTQYETWVSTNNGYDVVMHIDRANRVAVAATPANYINTIVDFPQGGFHYEDDEYGNRQTYLGVYPLVLDTTPLYGNAYNILQVSPTQEEWRLICDCLNPPTFVFNRVD